MNDFARYAVAVEVLLLFAMICGMVGIYHDQAPRIPRSVKLITAGVLWLLVGGVSAIVIGALSPTDRTAGVEFLAVFLLPSVALGVAANVIALRRPPPQPPMDPQLAAVYRNANELARAVEHIAHLDPCPNPDCGKARGILAALVDLPSPRS